MIDQIEPKIECCKCKLNKKSFCLTYVRKLGKGGFYSLCYDCWLKY